MRLALQAVKATAGRFVLELGDGARSLPAEGPFAEKPAAERPREDLAAWR